MFIYRELCEDVAKELNRRPNNNYIANVVWEWCKNNKLAKKTRLSKDKYLHKVWTADDNPVEEEAFRKYATRRLLRNKAVTNEYMKRMENLTELEEDGSIKLSTEPEVSEELTDINQLRRLVHKLRLDGYAIDCTVTGQKEVL